MNDIKVYGITGGAGTGKSEVMRMLRDDFGGLTVVTDDVARENERKGHCSYNKIVNAFGTSARMRAKLISAGSVKCGGAEEMV